MLICYNLYMRERVFLPLGFWVLAACLAVVLPQCAQGQETAVATKSSIVPKVDSKFNEALLYTSVLDYSVVPELSGAAAKCRAGEADACYFSYKFFENAADKKLSAAANLELAVLSLQRGLVKQAVKHISKAAQLQPEDPYIQLTKGWTLLSAGKYDAALKAFTDLLYLTADFEYVSSAKLGSALAYYYKGDADASAAELQYLYTANPYSISFVSYMLGKLAAEKKSSRSLAPVLLQQSLAHDAKNYPAALLMAHLTEKEGSPLQAWQYYTTLYALDPADTSLAKKTAALSKKIKGDPIDFLPYSRIDLPVTFRMPSVSSEKIKMALYAAADGEPVKITSFMLVPGALARVKDEKLGNVLQIRRHDRKTIEFNPQTGSVDFKDGRGNVEFSARRPFTVALADSGRTMVLSRVLADNIFAADLSDKELKGSLTVIPSEDGMTLVNTLPVEDLVPALAAVSGQELKEASSLQALSVVLRSALVQAAKTPVQTPYHITDNGGRFRFKGMNMIFPGALSAARATASVLVKGMEPGYYDNCGALSASRTENTSHKPAYVFSPANIGKYMISNPPADLFSKPQDLTRWAGIKWLYAYDANQIAARVGYKKNIGKLRGLQPLRRSPNGRILSMKFVGSKGDYVAQTPQETAFLLSAGTMRSNFFEAVPLYKGKNIRTVLVRGYDTGFGEGLCLHGADGLAKNGADYKGIIKYYFPNARIVNTKTGIVN